MFHFLKTNVLIFRRYGKKRLLNALNENVNDWQMCPEGQITVLWYCKILNFKGFYIFIGLRNVQRCEHDPCKIQYIFIYFCLLILSTHKLSCTFNAHSRCWLCVQSTLTSRHKHKTYASKKVGPLGAFPSYFVLNDVLLCVLFLPDPWQCPPWARGCVPI